MLEALSNNFPVSSTSPTSSFSLMRLSLMCPQRVFQTRNTPWIIHHKNQHGNLKPVQSDGLDAKANSSLHCFQCWVMSELVIVNISIYHPTFFNGQPPIRSGTSCFTVTSCNKWKQFLLIAGELELLSSFPDTLTAHLQHVISQQALSHCDVLTGG